MLAPVALAGEALPFIITADRLVDGIDSRAICGTLIIVRVANTPTFKGSSPFVNTINDKNLNRSFPGSKDRTQAGRITEVLSRGVAARGFPDGYS